MNIKPFRSTVQLVLVFAAAPDGAYAAFPAPITANPAAEYTAAISVNHNAVQSYTRTLSFDLNNPTVNYPKLYWFKYTSDGQSIAKFDTLGSDFGTNGPGNPSGGGMVLGSYNQSQIAVYRSDGVKMGISKGSQNFAGDPVTLYPGYTTDSTKWYYSQGLSEAYFQPSPPSNPHHLVSPTDPTPFTAWAAPGNSGNSQKYFPPHYPTSLNEYQVWNTALGTIMLDNNNQPVINPNTGEPRSNPGWRYFDRARHGPGAPWNRAGVLPAGDYYIAVSSPVPTFQGDTAVEEVLRAPVHFDYSTFQNNQRQLTAPLGTFQYYIGQSPSNYYGTIRLNVSSLPVGVNNSATWTSATSGNWQDAAKWTGGVPNGADSTARLLSAITSPQTLSLTQKTVLGSLWIDNSAAYTMSGSEYLAFFSSLGTSTIDIASGTHHINAPVQFHNTMQVNVNTGAALNIGQKASYFTAVTINKTGGGTLTMSAGGGSASVDMPVYATLNLSSGAVNLAGDHELGAMTLTTGTSVAVGFNGVSNAPGKLRALQLTVNGAGTANLSTRAAADSVVAQNLLQVSAGASLRKTGQGVVATKSLSLDATARLDLSGGGMMIDYTGDSILTTIRNLIVSGRNDGAWDGMGISSSAAAGDPLTGIGYTDTSITGSTPFGDQSADADAILVRYTRLGDTNVDAVVDSLDFNALLSGYGRTLDSHWFQGDYNFDGKVNTIDFNYLAGNFGLSAPNPFPAPALGSLIPEPASMSMLFFLAGVAGRRVR